jgi:ABC-type lipoprotein export system ATPase subunit
MIALEHVWKRYQINLEETFVALKGVSLRIEKGEFVAITGPSGCGKSTTMQILGLLDRPSEGKVLIAEKDASQLPDSELSRLRNEYIGFVFQQFNLITKLTLLENILVPTLYTRKKLDYDPTEYGRYLLTRFGLESKIHSYPNRISGGQQQRVAIARALIMKPEFILADEPTGNLDTKTGDEIMQLLIQLNTDGNTVVIVTHEPDIAARARRQIRMIDGTIHT